MDDCPLKRQGKREYYCTVELALQVLGGKWKPIILWHLSGEGVKRFSELKRSMPNVTQKMLTQQLREMESDGLIVRTVYPQVPPRVEYGLTEMGRSVLPILKALSEWGKSFQAWSLERGVELIQVASGAENPGSKQGASDFQRVGDQVRA